MNRLAHIQSLYHSAGAELSLTERINLCADIIYTSHRYLSRYGGKLSVFARSRAARILQQAQEELSELLSGKH